MLGKIPQQTCCSQNKIRKIPTRKIVLVRKTVEMGQNKRLESKKEGGGVRSWLDVVKGNGDVKKGVLRTSGGFDSFRYIFVFCIALLRTI